MTRHRRWAFTSSIARSSIVPPRAKAGRRAERHAAAQLRRRAAAVRPRSIQTTAITAARPSPARTGRGEVLRAQAARRRPRLATRRAVTVPAPTSAPHTVAATAVAMTVAVRVRSVRRNRLARQAGTGVRRHAAAGRRRTVAAISEAATRNPVSRRKAARQAGVPAPWVAAAERRTTVAATHKAAIPNPVLRPARRAGRRRTRVAAR